MGVIDTDRRWLVIVAHPDDEVLGCGALLSRLRDVDVVHVTDGAPRDGDDARRHGFETPASYAAARWREARAALDLAGVPAGRHHGLWIADQAATGRMAEVARLLAPLVVRADAVLTHAYEGGHPDHDAVAFAAHGAARRAGRPVFEMPFYHAAPEGWTRQRFLPIQSVVPFSPHGRMGTHLGEPRWDPRWPDGVGADEEGIPALSDASESSSGATLGPLIRRGFATTPFDRLRAGSSPARGEGEPSGEIETLSLTDTERALKRRMAACHATQGDTLASFDLDREVFRRAPAYDFTRLPHGGDLLYERHGWNLDRAGWLAAVRAAEAELSAAP